MDVTDSSCEDKNILVVDDDHGILRSVKTMLVGSGFSEPVLISDSRKVKDAVLEHDFQLVLLDLLMPFKDGMKVLKEIKAEKPEMECIIITAVDEVATAVKAIRYGAFDYMVKPLDPEKLIIVVKNALERYRLRKGLTLFQKPPSFNDIKKPAAFASMIVNDKKMALVFQQVEVVAPTDYSVVITGETGTGKEMLARIIHNLSSQSKGPFVPVNMAAFNRNTFEDEFFGHVKGAFTGAIDNKKGFFESARGGTLFLDEIGELEPGQQAKILRVIQEREFYKLGSTHTEPIDIRLLSATNRDIQEEISKNTFRADLFHRLKEFHIHLPPLRERRDDIIPLSIHFLKKHSKINQKYITGIGSDLHKALLSYDFPGNVRELENIIASAVLIESGGILGLQSVRSSSGNLFDNPQAIEKADDGKFLPLSELERRHIMKALDLTYDNRTKAANLLGISIRTLQRKLKEYNKEED